jgi:hypothetical protein
VQAGRATDTVAAFANLWYADVVSRTNSEPRNIRRVLDKDVLPAIGDKPVAEVTIPDIPAITDAVKARGADQMALQTRNVIKRLYAYAIARGKTQFNPAAAIEARFIATARGRDVALSQAEIGQLLRGIYQSSIRRPYKLALHQPLGVVDQELLRRAAEVAERSREPLHPGRLAFVQEQLDEGPARVPDRAHPAVFPQLGSARDQGPEALQRGRGARAGSIARDHAHGLSSRDFGRERPARLA